MPVMPVVRALLRVRGGRTRVQATSLALLWVFHWDPELPEEVTEANLRPRGLLGPP